MLKKNQSHPSTAALDKLSRQLEAALEKKFAQQMRALSRDTEKMLGRMLEGSLQKLSEDIGRAAAGAAGSGGKSFSASATSLGNALGKLVGTLVEEALTKTSVTTAETQRSRDAATSLKLSKSQQQAAQAAQTHKGSRNL